MTLTLLLIRHATARPALAGRPTRTARSPPRGGEEAGADGAWVAARRLMPEEALCSYARRTRETLELMARTGHRPLASSTRPVLYAARPEAALALLAGSEAATVALVGHNPTMGLLAERLAREPRRGGIPARHRGGAAVRGGGVGVAAEARCVAWSSLAGGPLGGG